MRGSVILLVGASVLMSLMGATTTSADARVVSATDDPNLNRQSGEGISYARQDQPVEGPGTELELYRFRFEPFAFLPGPDVAQDTTGEPIQNQAMTVFVDDGPFALYTPEGIDQGDVIVVTGNQRTLYLETWGADSREGDPEPCSNPCAVTGNKYVLLKTGDYVFYKGGTYCPICNDSSSNVGTVYVAPITMPEEGLEVLSWTLADRVLDESAGQQGTPTAEAEDAEAERAEAEAEEAKREFLDDTPPCGGRYT